jgi:hypothetical protein
MVKRAVKGQFVMKNTIKKQKIYRTGEYPTKTFKNF